MFGVRRLLLSCVLLPACIAVLAVSPAQAQEVPIGLERVNALGNDKLDIDGVDDKRVDIDVAVLDSGIDLNDPDLNVVAGLNCLNASQCTSNSLTDGDDTAGHGTGVARGIGAIDNAIGTVGAAPGARLWALQVVDATWFSQAVKALQDREKGQPWDPILLDLEPTIAAVEWVTDHSQEIEILHMAVPCTTDPDPQLPEPICVDDNGQVAELEAAIEEAVDEGVVVVTPAGNARADVAESIPPGIPEVVTVSAIFDSDGKPGGGGKDGDPCAKFFPAKEKDDTNADTSHYGVGVDVTAPGPCTSGAAPYASAAVAMLADRPGYPTEDGGDVEAISEAIFGDSDCAEPKDVGAGSCDWIHEAPDSVQEPLIDLGNEAIFDPLTTPGCAATAAADAESDVDGDGHADLVDLRSDGTVRVHRGGADGKFGAAVVSFDDEYERGPRASALYIGEGHHVVDVADVTGDGCDDLVTLASDSNAYVFPGKPDGTFGPQVFASPSPNSISPGLLKEGGHEAIAAADVNGDARADLVTYRDTNDDIRVFLGQANGTFASPITGVASTVYSALHTGSGEYFVDVGDVTDDGRADLVSMTTWDDIWVRAGKTDGTFASPVGTEYYGKFTVDPAMEDGVGEEPLGLGDVNGDGNVDLVTAATTGNSYTYFGTNGGWFEAKVKAGPGTSTTFNSANLFEIVGVLDVDGDSHSDIVALNSEGALTGTGESNGAWGSVALSLSGLKSNQHFQNQATGSEMVIEKPAYRRRGCASNGCHQYLASPSLTSGFGASTRNGGVDLFITNAVSLGQVSQRSWSSGSGWSGWLSHGSPAGQGATSQPAAASPTSDSIHLFAGGSDEGLWQRVWTDGSGKWSEWSLIPNGGTMATDPGPVAIVTGTGQMQVFARAKFDNSVWYRKWSSGSGWAPSWEPVPGATATGIGAAYNGAVNLFMRDAGGDVIQRWCCVEGKWTSPGSHGSPLGAGATSAPTAVSVASGTHVFVRGSDRALWEKTWSNSEAKWSGWTRLGGVLRAGPTAVAPTSDQIHVFAYGAGTSLWRKRWSASGGWSGWEPVS